MKLLVVSLICGVALVGVGQWMTRRPWGQDVGTRYQWGGITVAVVGGLLGMSGWVSM